MKLSVIIPVYNEEATLKAILEKVISVKLPEKVKKEIVLIDDGSTDKSWQIIKKTKSRNIKKIQHKVNKGKGAAIKTGLDKATGDVLVIQDADLEYNPQDFKKMLKPILNNKYEVVYGSRLKNYPLHLFGRQKTPLATHYFGNKFLTLMTNLLYGTNISDMETCYKMFSREVVDGMRLQAQSFELEPELTAKIIKRGYEIYEVPIKVKPRGYAEGKKITWKHGFRALWTLIKYRFVD